MKIAFSTTGLEMNSPIDPRFGRSEYFIILDEKDNSKQIIDNSAITSVAHGAGPRTAQKIIEAGVGVLITGNGPGNNAARVLNTSGVRILVGAGGMTVDEAYRAYKDNKLKQF
ncbi:MAG: NifB/NifX family molybdenum-iron cluster-binding protein [Candidatus Cloacimonetes bacterium]|nr:NifB/NifX family molybdenum-iron cluster-binding protein [Candidatus Cloacimonadota bacterium]